MAGGAGHELCEDGSSSGGMAERLKAAVLKTVRR